MVLQGNINTRCTATMRKRSNSALLRAHSRGSFERLLFESEHSNGLGHKDRSLYFRLAQGFVLALRLITPVSYLFLLVLAAVMTNVIRHEYVDRVKERWLGVVHQSAASTFGFYALVVWTVLEALFLPLYYYKYLQLSKNADIGHDATSRESRQLLVDKCLSALSLGAENRAEPEKYIRKVLEGWFLDLDMHHLHHSNIARWTSWAFFNKKFKELTAEEQEDNQSCVACIEKAAKWKFPEGFSKDMHHSARLNIDPLFATQRPLFFYATVRLLNLASSTMLRVLGFRRLYRFDLANRAQVIYYRRAKPTSPDTADSQNDSHTVDNKNKEIEIKKNLPIVFIHGIGIGLAAYLSLIMHFPTDVDVFLVEWAYVAMRFCESEPKIDASISAITQCLDEFQHPKACFVAHSLGTTLISWILKDKLGKERVHSTVMLDPVVFLTCDPTLATTFVYKDPYNLFDFLMHFFVARELFVAHAISRKFSWSHNILFVEDMLLSDRSRERQKKKKAEAERMLRLADSGMGDLDSLGDFSGIGGTDLNQPAEYLDHSIFLSLKDPLVPVESISRYLQRKTHLEGFRNYEVLISQGTHGEMLLYPSWVKLINQKIAERIRSYS